MKRHKFLIIVLLCNLIVLSSCYQDDIVVLKEPVIKQNESKELKILTIGHSFVTDAFSYIDDLCSDMHLNVSDVAIYQCSRGKANFKNWVDCWNDCDSGKYSIRMVLKEGMFIPGLYCSNRTGSDGSYLRNAIQNYKWDIIILSNGVDHSSDWNDASKGGYLLTLTTLIRQYQPTAKFYYLFPHQMWLESTSSSAVDTPYSVTQEKWQAYAEKMKWIEYEQGFEMMIPVGTAIENLRMTSLNHQDSNPTYNFTRDGWHLGTGLARYTASCCVFEKLIAPRYGVTVLDSNLKPKGTHSSNYRFPSGCINVNNDNAWIAKKSAIMAVEHPYQISIVEVY